VAQGIVICVAAGNEGPAPYSVGSPGCAREVITIGASALNDTVADFSSRGPTGDGRVKPDVLFPGVKIVAARAAGTSMGDVVNQLYTAASGTSMATPLAAGVCALLLQAEPSLSPAQVKARLMGTAVNLGVSPQAQGSGRADASRARHTEVTPTPEPPAPTPGPEPGPGTGQGCLPALMSLLFWKR
jgi:serine protease AprX